jgi:hypothetical protein
VLHATQEEIERAARMARAHDFIIDMHDGYDTIIGERVSSCPVVKNSAFRLRAHCCVTPRCSCWTRRPRPSICRRKN